MRIYIFLFVIINSIYGNFATKEEKINHYINHVQRSIKLADHYIGDLGEEKFSIPAMSSLKGRYMMHNLCTLKNACYLEIGLFQGGTFISAVKNNELKEAIGIDNWSYGTREECMNFCSQYLTKENYKICSSDCFSINKDEVFKNFVDIYFYDGDHSYEASKNALLNFDSILNDVFILVIDDWMHPSFSEGIQNGVKEGIKQLDYNILYERILYHEDYNIWWHGYYVAVISK